MFPFGRPNVGGRWLAFTGRPRSSLQSNIRPPVLPIRLFPLGLPSRASAVAVRHPLRGRERDSSAPLANC